ncbi:uncharacterized protein L201_004198 [Kwoniella dendrophila CBS 6074]|uniref:Myb-like domain-containing protein n=1 Tax=Kwoniella dendrophila CBS 6074 TaxID=1295534 RepID=A0AAX4JXC1_9TREE
MRMILTIQGEVPPKRERSEDSEQNLKPVTNEKKQKNSKKPSSPSKTKTSWSESEETKFREGINAIVKKHLWNELKLDPGLSKRGANGV